MYEFNEQNSDFVTETSVVQTQKNKKSKFKIVVAACVCAALFFGSAIGLAAPQIWKIYADRTEKNGIVQTHYGAQAQTVSTGKKPGEQLTTQEIAAKVGPAVVGIEKYGNYYYGNNIYGGTTALGSGSGVISTQDGYIITNYHVIDGGSEIHVVLNTGEKYTAKVIGGDADSDLAVLKIDAKNLPYATFGDSSSVTVGDTVVAIGNPLGSELMGTVTQGILSAVNRTIKIENKTMTLLQTDAAINSGNSGGALINVYGEVIGINSAKMAASGVEGLGFAIPSNTVLDVVEDLMDYGYVRGKLSVGIAGTNITEMMAAYYNLPVGFYVQEVYSGSGAAEAGIRVGDVVVKCDGKTVKTIDDINEIKQTHQVGDTMEITVVRNNKNKTIKVTLQEQKPESAW